MKCSQLREILKENKQIVSGNKQILVARCYALNPVIDDSEEIVEISETSKETRDSGESFDPLGNLKFKKELSYADLNFTAKGRQWETDLRLLPKTNFHQLYQYLVVKTNKYGDDIMKGECYKKMKSYQFFREGHIKSYEIARGFGKVWIKSKVIASMRHEMYRVIVICDEKGDILYGACECPAG